MALRRAVGGVLLVVSFSLLAACGASGRDATGLQVVAAENFWGNIAAQLGGSRATVTTVISNPNTDPHEYQSSALDARAFAEADLILLNGAGYDDWGQKLVSANPDPRREVLTVGDLLGKKPGDNPHFWYSPEYVTRVAHAITDDYKRLDAADAGYFDGQLAAFGSALQPYHKLIDQIGADDAGVPVASTESIFGYLAGALQLELISPPEFMQAISEGNEPPAQEVATFQNQLRTHQAKLLVYNTQTSTPITGQLKQLARSSGIPVVGISETLQPVGASFQDWQVKQLRALRLALGGA